MPTKNGRMTKAEKQEELEREIKAVYDLSQQAFLDNELSQFFKLTERLNGLRYARYLFDGQLHIMQCYQTGMNHNSNGAKYYPPNSASKVLTGDE